MTSLPSAVGKAVGALIADRNISLTPSSTVLDVGCGDRLGWVLELYSDHVFGKYVGIDKLEVEKLSFAPTEFRDPFAESTVRENPCDLECQYAYWREHTTVENPLTLVEFQRLVHINGSVDLEIGCLRDQLDADAKFDVVIVSDILHRLSPSTRRSLITDIRSALAPGGVAVVRYFTEETGHGCMGADEISFVDSLFGHAVEYPTEGRQSHTTRCYGGG